MTDAWKARWACNIADMLCHSFLCLELEVSKVGTVNSSTEVILKSDSSAAGVQHTLKQF